MTDIDDLRGEFANLARDIARDEAQNLEDRITNALRRVFAERDRLDAIRAMRDHGDERARLELEIARQEGKVRAQQQRLSDARQDGNEIEARKAQGAIDAELFRLDAPLVWHEHHSRQVLRTYQELFLRDAKAPLTPISPDLPEDVAELLQECLQGPRQSPVANLPTHEPDPAAG